MINEPFYVYTRRVAVPCLPSAPITHMPLCPQYYYCVESPLVTKCTEDIPRKLAKMESKLPEERTA